MNADRRRLLVALHLVPFAGIAFLWFVGVVRDRIGDAEDRFIATVFLGSGLLLLAMLFVSTAVAGALIVSEGSSGAPSQDAEVWAVGTHLSVSVLTVYAMRMAGVFMISTATVSLRTSVMPRWLAGLGYLLAACLLVGVGFLPWAELLFPAWVLVVSIYLILAVHRADEATGS